MLTVLLITSLILHILRTQKKDYTCSSTKFHLLSFIHYVFQALAIYSMSTFSIKQMWHFVQKYTLEDYHPTIHFKSIGTFPSRHWFGAFLLEEEVVVCGGEAENGELLQDMTRISLTDGSLKAKLKQFPAGKAICSLEILNIPEEFLTNGKIWNRVEYWIFEYLNYVKWLSRVYGLFFIHLKELFIFRALSQLSL